MLNRNDIINRRPTIEPIPVPELGADATVGVKLLSAAEFLRLSAASKDAGDQAYAYWLLACVCDDAGSPIFVADDLPAVTGLPFPLVQRLLEAAQRINGTAETAAKNQRTRAAGSSSASR